GLPAASSPQQRPNQPRPLSGPIAVNISGQPILSSGVPPPGYIPLIPMPIPPHMLTPDGKLILNEHTMSEITRLHLLSAQQLSPNALPSPPHNGPPPGFVPLPPGAIPLPQFRDTFIPRRHTLPF